MTTAHDTGIAWHCTDRQGIDGIRRDAVIRPSAILHAYTSPPTDQAELLDRPMIWFSTNEFCEPSIGIGRALLLARDEPSTPAKAALLCNALEATGGLFRIGYPADRLLPVLGLLQPPKTDQPHRHDWRVTFNEVPLADCIGIDALEIDDDLSLTWKRIWSPTPVWHTVAPWPASVFTQFPSNTTKANHHAAPHP